MSAAPRNLPAADDSDLVAAFAALRTAPVQPRPGCVAELRARLLAEVSQLDQAGRAGPPYATTGGAEPALRGDSMTQITSLRGQLELVGGQGRVLHGFVRIPALVRNHSEEWADVVVSVELLDAAGQVLVNRAAPTAGEQLRSAYPIPPGGVMFYLYLRAVERLTGQYATHRLRLRQAYAGAPAGTAQATITSQAARQPAYAGAPTYLARGTVTAATRCAEPLVVAAGFDAAGNLLDVAAALLYPRRGLREFGTDLSELAAGATGHFTLAFLVPGIQSVQAVALCL